MKNYFVRISVNDPYPKQHDTTAKASTLEVAIKRAIKEWRKKEWARRPLKEITIKATLL